ncbi:replication protein, partial [Streptococcus suis]|nr:replication protein [Streptococcus suis]
MLTGLFANHHLWSKVARHTKYKYRNLLKEIANDDELTQHLKASFSENAKDLKDELDSWLTGLDVTEDESDNSGAV